MPVRWLNLQEFQSKKLMADNGLHVQRFKVTDNAKEAVQIAKELSKYTKTSNGQMRECILCHQALSPLPSW